MAFISSMRARKTATSSAGMRTHGGSGSSSQKRDSGSLLSAQNRSSMACTDRAMNVFPHASEPSENTMPRGPSILWTHHSKLFDSQPKGIECRLHQMRCVSSQGAMKLLNEGWSACPPDNNAIMQTDASTPSTPRRPKCN